MAAAPEQAHRSAVAGYRNYLGSRPDLVTLAQVEVAGRDLACPCSPEMPCHVDLLLEVAAGRLSVLAR
ncbi:DUF4326 domain-containing protein [Streptosporangium sp. NBC_01639]|uniref:DUF4326 domain-containing protein n=1 Tax=Streptosporangium sp. NBC_01639 TaxID=2975948 RepID=UPI00386FF444